MDFSAFYDELQQDKNLLSYWFPAVKDCGLRVPDTKIIHVPENVAFAFFMENSDKDFQTIFNWVNEVVMPVVKEFSACGNQQTLFMKNGCFSDKFDAGNCFVGKNAYEITHKLIIINYDAIMFDAYGITELVLRKCIPFDESDTPCIYHGLPLRPEFRVFYDFDKHKVLYSVNYWNWNYCHEAMVRNATDKIVYEESYPFLSKMYDHYHVTVECAVEEHLHSVTSLSGCWSVDILFDDEANMWLIDMAIAEQSAYWDPGRCK